ncbi:28 kDa ribonucleoprotein, chloroplastic-like [Typha latifolia]|uniref:28 kDa ribonucleoprotein, chloroplastic-like n=1 Tax=Typha latifolia TaxID=4733 RepID=UPI003C2F2972
MVNLEDSEKAIDMFNYYELDGRKLTVNKATPRGSKPVQSSNYVPSHKIYVGNLPWQVDDAQLEELFGEHGKVISARIVYEMETGRSRGFGFVRMSIESKVDDWMARS